MKQGRRQNMLQVVDVILRKKLSPILLIILKYFSTIRSVQPGHKGHMPLIKFAKVCFCPG